MKKNVKVEIAIKEKEKRMDELTVKLKAALSDKFDTVVNIYLNSKEDKCLSDSTDHNPVHKIKNELRVQTVVHTVYDLYKDSIDSVYQETYFSSREEFIKDLDYLLRMQFHVDMLHEALNHNINDVLYDEDSDEYSYRLDTYEVVLLTSVSDYYVEFIDD